MKGISRFVLTVCMVLVLVTGTFRADRPVSAQVGNAFTCGQVGIPALHEPADGSELLLSSGGSLDVVLHWAAASGAVRYELEVYHNAPLYLISTQLVDGQGGGFSTGEEALYRWRVRGVPAEQGCPPGAWSDTWDFAVLLSKLQPPANVQASDGQYATQVDLTWQVDDSAGQEAPAGFRIERSERYAGERQLLAELAALDRRYTDTSAGAGQLYYYWITALSGAGERERPAEPDAGWAGSSCPLVAGAPELTGPANGTVYENDPDGWEGVWLNWDDLSGTSDWPGHARYEFQLADAGSGALIEQRAVEESSGLLHPAPGSYRWRSRGLNPFPGCPAGAWSGWRNFEVVAFQSPLAPSGLRASDGEYADRVTLSWSLDGNTLLPLYFEVYRAASLNGEKTLIYQTENDLERWFDDRTALPGRRYVYWVVSYHELRGRGWSAPDEGWAAAAQMELGYTIFLPITTR